MADCHETAFFHFIFSLAYNLFNMMDTLSILVHSGRAGLRLVRVPQFCLSVSRNKGAVGQKVHKNRPFSPRNADDPFCNLME